MRSIYLHVRAYVFRSYAREGEKSMYEGAGSLIVGLINQIRTSCYLHKHYRESRYQDMMLLYSLSTGIICQEHPLLKVWHNRRELCIEKRLQMMAIGRHETAQSELPWSVRV